MKKVLLSPLFAPVATVLAVGLCIALSWILHPGNPTFFFDEDGENEFITYAGYGIGLIVALGYARDYLKTDRQASYFALLFLWLSALLREAGIQHWLTDHDTTAIKLRFFTNPNNPLSEKIVAAVLVVVVLGTAVWLLCRYMPGLFRGFLALNPLAWTVATFGGVGVVSQFADRFPSNYFKATGVRLDDTVIYWFKAVEESGEATLPLLFALGFIQYHLLREQNRPKSL